MTTTFASLTDQYTAFRAENPKSRIRDAATQLGVSEAELVATGLGTTATRFGGNPLGGTPLDGDFRELLKQVPTLGHVMALTRNDSVVHERKGTYQNVSFTGHMGLVIGEAIDLRLFMSQWKFGFAVNEAGRRSLQFFAGDGEAVHKIYLTDQSDVAAYDTLVATYTADDQSDALRIEPKPEPAVTIADAAIDGAAFRQGWLELTDTHEFFGLLRKHNVSRLQAMRLAPEGHAIPTSMAAVKRVFERVAEMSLPIMIFVSSRGCIQIHTGEVHKLLPMGPWFNVMDPDFNLHLREDHVASAWVVKKPTSDGVVTSLELFDAEGQQIALIFGKRKPGIPEMPEWQQVLAELATEPA